MNSYRVSFEMSVLCNYTCSYCDAYGTKPFPKEEDVLKVIQNTFKLGKPKVSFYFLGGEPTIYPGMMRVLEEIYSYGDRVGYVLLQTNLTKPISWFDKLTAQFKDLKICASYQNHQTKDFSKYLQKLEFLKGRGSLEGCDVMLEYINPDEIKERVEEMKEIGVDPDLRVIDYRSVSKNRIRDVVYAKAYGGTIEEEELDNRDWNGYLCNAGEESLVIDNNFEAYPCFSAYYKKSQYRIKSFGNMLTDLEVIKNKVKTKTICKWGSCSCEPDKRMYREEIK